MRYFWIEHTVNSQTLMCLQDTPFQQGKPRRVAYVSPSFTFGDGLVELDSKWRAQIVSTREEKIFSSLAQAKDWAQAVVLLNQ